jgi:H+/gluconate symporter-like permease
MELLICLAALGTLILLAYRGYSVILVAPLVAMAAVLLTQPSGVAPAYSGLFMDKAASFIRNYFPVFLLGAVFGKLIEVSGAARAIVAAITAAFGPRHAILAITLVGMILTYGGVSIYVVVFAIYPFAAEMFRAADIPKRLIPATIAFSALTVTMDALPGTPQIQNIIPTTFFRTTAYAAPLLGIIASIFSFTLCYAYLEWQRRKAAAAGEGYGTGHINEPESPDESRPMPLALALLPLILVAVGNRVALTAITQHYGQTATAILSPQMAAAPLTQDVKANAALWAVEAALLLGIVAIAAIARRTLKPRLAALTQVAVSGSLLASMNTAAEYGFGAIIAALPGFHLIADALGRIGNPLLNLALTTNILAGMTGSASGGLSLTLGAFSDRFIRLAADHGIPLEVMHRIASLASGGMDTLPHNGAIVTLLAVCGMTHRQSYRQIFGLTLLKTLTAFFTIAVYYATGLI